MGIVKLERIYNESQQTVAAIWKKSYRPSQGGFKAIWGRIQDQDHAKVTLEQHHSPGNSRFNVNRIHYRPIQYRFEVVRIHKSSQDSVQLVEQIHIRRGYGSVLNYIRDSRHG
jgi:hypothetical protein